MVIAVIANDTDADSDLLTVTEVTAPAYGTATITRDDAGNDTQVTYTTGEERRPRSPLAVTRSEA